MIFKTPFGNLYIHTDAAQLIKIDFVASDEKIEHHEKTNKKVCDELKKYFQNPKHAFNLNYELSGTPFQLKVWKALCKIPVGQTESYSSLAKKLKTSARAIGNACRDNPIPIVIPCHRVVAKHHIGGFAGTRTGAWLKIKEWLLRHEGIQYG